MKDQRTARPNKNQRWREIDSKGVEPASTQSITSLMAQWPTSINRSQTEVNSSSWPGSIRLKGYQTIHG